MSITENMFLGSCCCVNCQCVHRHLFPQNVHIVICCSGLSCIPNGIVAVRSHGSSSDIHSRRLRAICKSWVPYVLHSTFISIVVCIPRFRAIYRYDIYFAFAHLTLFELDFHREFDFERFDPIQWAHTGLMDDGRFFTLVRVPRRRPCVHS